MRNDSRDRAGRISRLNALPVAIVILSTIFTLMITVSQDNQAIAASEPRPLNPPGPCEILCPPAADGPTSSASTTSAATLPVGFQESVVFAGLTNPTAVQFASDGRVFVAEKSGLIKVFASLAATTPTVFADLNIDVYNFWDRGLLGLALDPNFPSSPYVYVLYTYDALIGGVAPRWGTPGTLSDPCPTPPGPTTDGCVVSGRVSRLTASGDTMVAGSERILIEDWCQQYPSHSIGALAFGADGALYISAGEGASFTGVDYGQLGNTYPGDIANPCGDPTNEGGALRSQDLRTSPDPVGLSGAILRVDPATGLGLSDNPLAGSTSENARRTIAYGLRNPFRFTLRPGAGDIWIGDVGWNDWEEIDRLSSPTAGVSDFGWPCYEGAARQASYESVGLPICSNLYATPGAVATPFYAYAHTSQVVPGETCPAGGASISGLAFNPGGSYPPEYDGALFFGDYTRNCIWVIFKGSNGLPNPATVSTFVAGAAAPVDLRFGPSGDLFYVDFTGGTIRRVEFPKVNDVNRALGRPATASTADGPLVPGNAFDGDLSTRWSSVLFTDPEWIYVDLGAQYAIGRVRLLWEVAYASAYKIQVSNDASSWVDIYSTTTGDGALDDLTGLNGFGRYVRMFGTTRGTPWGYSLWEFEVYSGSAPTITAISPTSGPPAGGTPVTVTGSGFDTTSGATTIAFAGTPATNVSCSSATSCLATSPAGAGTVHVTATVGGVTSATSSSDQFTYTAGAAPTVTAISPTAGPAAGGTIVTITGTGFDTTSGATTIAFAGTPATNVSCSSATSCLATSPAGSGTVHVTATVGGVTSATSSSDQFTYSSNRPPIASISTPSPTLTWKVGDLIGFSGSATDPEDGALPASALSWSVILWHCPSDCHTHVVQTFSGVASGSFVAPDHDYPAYLVLQLTATDTGGQSATTSIQLDPQTVLLSFQSLPSGLQIVVGSYSPMATPFERRVIVGSNNTITAATPQSLSGQSYAFASWSDGGARTHTVVANTAATFTATFVDITAPTISGIRDTNVSSTGVVITWTTNEASTSQIEYWTGSGAHVFTTLDPRLLLSHSVTITGLRSKTTYHYRVRSQDAAGNLAISADTTFRTTK